MDTEMGVMTSQNATDCLQPPSTHGCGVVRGMWGDVRGWVAIGPHSSQEVLEETRPSNPLTSDFCVPEPQGNNLLFSRKPLL